MEVYFSTSGVECAVVILEEHRGIRLVASHPTSSSVFSLPVPLRLSSLTHRTQFVSGTGAASMENVAVFDSPGKGRGLKATKEFWAGDIIFSEPSLAAVVFDRYRR